MHKLLIRQLKRFLGDIDIESLPASWQKFLQAVSDTYVHSDQDRDLILRSLELSSKEFAELSEKLRRQNEIIEQKVKERTQELEYERAKLNSIVQNMDTAAFLFDSDGKLIFINNSAKKILGVNEETKTEEIIEKLFSMFESVSLQEYFQECIKGHPNIIPEVDYQNKVFRIALRCIFSQNSIVGHFIWIDDITEQKLLDRAKDEFLAIASHQMRTPLAVIRGNAELIINWAKKTNTEDIFDKAMTIENNAARLLQIANDYLDLVRLETGKLKLNIETFNPYPILKNLIDNFRPLAEKKGLYLEDMILSDLPEIKADKDRFIQIIENLLSNAIQYTDKGSVTLAAFKDNEFVKITVSDTGPGIPPERQKNIFQKFQPGGKKFLSTTQYGVYGGGSGLGLYICKLLADSIKASLVLEKTEIGKGTTFALFLPIAES